MNTRILQLFLVCVLLYLANIAHADDFCAQYTAAIPVPIALDVPIEEDIRKGNEARIALAVAAAEKKYPYTDATAFLESVEETLRPPSRVRPCV